MVLDIRAGRDVVTGVKDAAEFGIYAAGTVISYAEQAGSRVYHAVTQAARAVGHELRHVVRNAWHEVTKAAAAAEADRMPPARLAASRIVRRSPPEQGMPPVARAAVTASQAMAAMGLPLLMPCSMNRLAKSPRRRNVPLLMSSSVTAFERVKASGAGAESVGQVVSGHGGLRER